VTTTLAQYVRADTGDLAFVTECEAAAHQLVSQLVGDVTIPAEPLAAALLDVGANLYQRRITQHDMPDFAGDGTITSPWRPARDPLTAARAILRPWLGPGLA